MYQKTIVSQFYEFLEKKLTRVATMIRNTMLRDFVVTAIISLEEIKNLGIALTKSYMLVDFAKTAISINTIW
jgi:hypothetical protein